MVIALTGGICCGKTTVLNLLIEMGYIVYNADDIAHEVLKMEKVKQKISATLFCYTREQLSKVVFNDANKRKILNDITHPLIIQKMLDIIKNVAKEKIVFFEVPLLYELNLEKYFDKVIVIYVDRYTQIKRLMIRNNKSETEAINILNSQMDIEEKKKKTEYILENFEIKDLKKNLIDLLERIKDENK